MRPRRTFVDMSPLPEIPSVEVRHCPGRIGYAVGSDGTIWSCRASGKAIGRYTTWRQLRPCTGKNGYPCVTVQGRRRNENVCVHTLVLEAFVGARPPGQESRHYDGNRGNPALSNLSWGTTSQNTQDKRRHGTYHEGEKHGNAKLTETDVREIRDQVAAGMSQRELTQHYGIHVSNISHIVRRVTWAHVT